MFDPVGLRMEGHLIFGSAEAREVSTAKGSLAQVPSTPACVRILISPSPQVYSDAPTFEKRGAALRIAIPVIPFESQHHD